MAIAPAPAGSQTPSTTIVVFGDSLTAGLGLPRSSAFPAQLESWLRWRRVAARVVNAGKSGDTTAAAMPRLGQALAAKPSLVILELGTNDALRGVDPARSRANLAAMIDTIRQSGARVLLTGVLAPPNWGEEYRRAFDRIFPDLARAYQVPIYPFFLAGVAGDRQLNQPDGLHPNASGVARIVDRLAPIVWRLFLHADRPGPPKPS